MPERKKFTNFRELQNLSMLYSLDGQSPEIDPTAFVAPSADIIGEVNLGAYSSVWFHCTLRGDGQSIVVGEYSNIQDNTVVHIATGKMGCQIGRYVTVGHSCVIHACTLKDYSFVGMGAVVMDGAVVESFGFVAAGALVLPGFVVPAKHLVAGVPAKIIREIKSEEEEMIRYTAELYVQKAKKFKEKFFLLE